MKRAFFKRDFHNNTPVMVQMFALRASGIPLQALSRRYDRDRQTLRLQLYKHQIEPLSGILKTHWGGLELRAVKPVVVSTLPKKHPWAGKYDYLIDELWENRTLGI